MKSNITLLKELLKLRSDVTKTQFSPQSLAATLELVRECLLEFSPSKTPPTINVSLQSQTQQERTVISAIVVVIHQIVEICRKKLKMHSTTIKIMDRFDKSCRDVTSFKLKKNAAGDEKAVRTLPPMKPLFSTLIEHPDSPHPSTIDSDFLAVSPNFVVETSSSSKRKRDPTPPPSPTPSTQSSFSDHQPKKHRKTNKSCTKQPRRRVGARKNHSSETRAYLKQWLEDHKDYPYPTDAEKQEIAARTDMSVEQLNHWLVNGRRRYLRHGNKLGE